MAYIETEDTQNYGLTDKVTEILKKYKEAQSVKDYWKDKFEEAYEYCLPNRESFYDESPGQKRTDKIFDETAVVGVQEFASRLQAGITPTFARWADFQAGSEIPPEQRPGINQELDKITDYVFQVLQTSNFNQEIHEAFMDLAIGTGILLVEEGDAINPIKFTSVPLTRVCLMNGPDGKIDTVYRTRTCKPTEIHLLYPKAKLPENFDPLKQKKDIKLMCKLVLKAKNDFQKIFNDSKFYFLFHNFNSIENKTFIQKKLKICLVKNKIDVLQFIKPKTFRQNDWYFQDQPPKARTNLYIAKFLASLLNG